jgi:uncharacterized protein
MNLREQFTEGLKVAMKARDQIGTSTFRLMIAELKKRDIEARGKGNAEGVSDEELAQMLQTMVKQRRESIDLYRKGARDDLADKEAAEIAIIERFMPKQMSEAEAEAAIQALIAATGAVGPKDMGKVMGALKAKFAGQIDLSRAGPTVKRLLSG